jgi:photosystem II stability/assembly factor-like uncharacterized protein
MKMFDKVFANQPTSLLLYCAICITMVTQGYGMDVWESIPSGKSAEITVLHEHNGYFFAGTVSGGVYRSSDGGNTWYLSMTSKRLSGRWTTHLVQCFFSYNSVLYCGTNTGLEVSTDNGNSWSSLFDGMNIHSISASIDVVWLGGDGIHYINTRTNETGVLNSSPHFGSVYSLDCHGDTIIAGYCCGYGLYRSTDKGITWSRVEYNIKPTSIMKIERIFDYDFILNGSELLRCKPSETYWQTCGDKKLTQVGIRGLTSHKGSLFAYTSTDGILSSIDSGLTWLPFTLRPTRNSITALLFPIEDENIALVGLDAEVNNRGGIAICNLQSKELKYTVPCISTQRYDNILNLEDKLIAFGVYGHGVQVEPLIGKFTIQRTDTLSEVQLATSNSNSYFIYSNSGVGAVYAINKRTKDLICITNSYRDFGSVNTLTANDIMIAMITDEQNVLVTTNGGKKWENVYSSQEPTKLPRSLALSGQTILINTLEGILRSKDMGLTWETISHPTAVKTLSAMLGNILLLTDSGLYMSTDEGESWLRQNIGKKIPEYIVPALNTNTVCIACNTGIYKLNTTTMDWEALYEAKNNEYFTALSVDNSNIIAARNSNGLWRLRKGELSGEVSAVVSTQGKCLPVSVELLYLGMPVDSLQWSVEPENTRMLKNRVNDTTYITEAGDYRLQLKAYKKGNVFSYSEYLSQYRLIDTTLQILNTTIVSNATDVSYQWLDCSSSCIPVVGETSKTFAPRGNGRYAVEVSQDGCIDTSMVIDYSTVNKVQSSELGVKSLVVFPNPSSDKVKISFVMEKHQHILIDIVDVNGSIITTILDQDMTSGNHQFMISSTILSNGYYQVRLHNGTEIISQPLVIYR